MLNSEGNGNLLLVILGLKRWSHRGEVSPENRLVQLSWSPDSCAKGKMEQNLETLTAAP